MKSRWRYRTILLALISAGAVQIVEVWAAPLDKSLGRPFEAAAGASTTTKGINGYSDGVFDKSAGIMPARMSALLNALQPDRSSTRGVAEARLFAAVAPGVVLIATNEGLGSGSVISASGLILTNLHVVGTNETVAVVFKPRVEGAKITDANILMGTVVRRDQVTDLALVQVKDVPANIKVIPFAAMTDITVGSDVHAIGHPTGEAWTYTKGIVSQIRRDYQWSANDGGTHTASVIQTQTPINPGNSGGPLLTERGALVGVNSFKTQGEGLNFAVSIDDVRVLLGSKSDRVMKNSSQGKQKTDCSLKSYGVSRLKDGSGTSESFDTDCDGKPNAVLITPDDPNEPMLLQLDPDNTGKVTGVLVSSKRDGRWDISIWDTTGTGKPSLQCVHADGGIKPTRCEKYTG